MSLVFRRSGFGQPMGNAAGRGIRARDVLRPVLRQSALADVFGHLAVLVRALGLFFPKCVRRHAETECEWRRSHTVSRYRVFFRDSRDGVFFHIEYPVGDFSLKEWSIFAYGPLPQIFSQSLLACFPILPRSNILSYFSWPPLACRAFFEPRSGRYNFWRSCFARYFRYGFLPFKMDIRNEKRPWPTYCLSSEP